MQKLEFQLALPLNISEMFAYYQSQVLLAYREKKAGNALSLNLIYSTPSKLKAECMTVLNERYRLKDEKVFRAFLGRQKDATAYMHAFKKLDADKLRPLDNFLKEKTEDTDEKNVELLAWLIDFEPRPYHLDWNSKNLPEGKINPALDRHDLIDATPFLNEQKGLPDNKISLKNTRLTFILLLITIGSIIVYLIWTKSENEGCMYWAGSNFHTVSCSKKMRDTLILALDTFKLNHFKRLNNPDTITEKAVGHVWYIKTNNRLEFFTSSGFYPADPKRNVKPISVYMIDKYILNK